MKVLFSFRKPSNALKSGIFRQTCSLQTDTAGDLDTFPERTGHATAYLTDLDRVRLELAKHLFSLFF